jgi:predicted DNA-binding transcriptional regulator AlpA
VRFADLKQAGLVRNWPTLLRLIDNNGFPPGFLLGRNTRVWVLDDVQAWIAARPIARKIMPPRRNASEAETASL